MPNSFPQDQILDEHVQPVIITMSLCDQASHSLWKWRLINQKEHIFVYLCNAKCSDVLAVRRGAVASSPQSRQDTANSLHSYTSVYCMIRWRRGAGQASTSVIITDWFHGRCQDACHHPQHWRHAHCGKPPLTYGCTGDIRFQHFEFFSDLVIQVLWLAQYLYVPCFCFEEKANTILPDD